MLTLRRSAVWGAIAFCVTLAVIIGIRLDQAALTMVVGVACGVGASVPTGLLVFFLMRRRGWSKETRMAGGLAQEMEQAPPYLVVAPPAASQFAPPVRWPGAYGQHASPQRKFAIIGEEGVDDGFEFWQE